MLSGQSDTSPRILHLVLDEKFIPFTQKLFEAAFPGRNQFRVYGVHPRGTPRFVRQDQNVKLVSRCYWFSTAMVEDLRHCDCLVVHYMTPWFARAVEAAPSSVTVVWVGWGGDFYHLLPDFANAMYLPGTRQILSHLSRFSVANPMQLLRTFVKWLGYRIFFNGWEQRMVGRVDVVSMLANEHRLLAASVQGIRARFFHFNWYYSAEDILMKGPQAMRGPDILVGNSASPTNNHVEAFSLLKNFDLTGRKIVVPLSYGDDAYAEEVCRLGARHFGERFLPLRRFLPIDEYNEMISTCGTVIMNHVRQQGFGNICTAMFKGARVFLRPENYLLPFLRDKGGILFDLPAGPIGEQAFFAPLSEEEACQNQAALMSFLSFERVVENARRLVDLVEENRKPINV